MHLTFKSKSLYKIFDLVGKDQLDSIIVRSIMCNIIRGLNMKTVINPAHLYITSSFKHHIIKRPHFTVYFYLQ